MSQGRVVTNQLLIKLDPENDRIKFKSGAELFLDTTFEPEKHVTVTGTVEVMPMDLFYTGKPNVGMPWKTDVETQVGDTVIMYYMAVMNCLRPEIGKYIIRGEDRYVFISYQNIYAIVRNGEIIPINGYCLVEPLEDFGYEENVARMKKAGIELVRLKAKSSKKATFGTVRYCGKPNKEYVDSIYSDKGVDVKPGDVVVMRRITDVPLEYEYHAKVDGGKKYWRIQRKNIAGVYETSIQR